ncbi:MAG: DUF3857 domain-containing protein [Chitinophagaceae bacterium]|nr:DUF3857 domain-containing protein [Chitinophagaceae bacterium]
MKLITIVIALFFKIPYSSAQSNFNSSTIADSLKKNANAVYRLDEGVIEIKSPGSYTFKNHQVITILNTAGLSHLIQSFNVSKFHNLENVQVKIYDSSGAEIKKYKKKDFTSQVYTDESTLLSDDKILYLQAFSPSIPCTIEIESEQRITSFIELPDWVIKAPHISVEKTKLTVQTQEEFDIRYNVKI